MSTEILIIDSDEVFVARLKDLLEKNGELMVLNRCLSSNEARDWCKAGKLATTDAIILSLTVPDRSGDVSNDCVFGLALLEELRKQHKFDRPIVVLTPANKSELGRQALTHRCNGFLSKPSGPEQLSQMLAELKLALTGSAVVVSNDLRNLVLPEQLEIMSTQEISALAEQNEAADAALHMLNAVDQLCSGTKREMLRESIKQDVTAILMQNLSKAAVWPQLRMDLERETGESNKTSDRLPGANSRIPESKDPQVCHKSLSTERPPEFLVQELLENTPRPIFITDNRHSIIFVNHAAERLFGWRKDQCLSRRIEKLFPPLIDHPANAEFSATCNKGTIPVSIESNTISMDNSFYTLHLLTDLTPQKHAEKLLKEQVSKLQENSSKLQQLVNTDPLTCLLNRRGLELILKREVAIVKRKNSKLSALLIDLDNFKGINDNYSHAVGDLVLSSVAKAIKDCLRTSDWVGRIGGDEFLVLLPEATVEEAAVVAERIRSSVASMIIPIDGYELRTTTSIGAVLLSSDTHTIEQILESSSSGLKASKRTGKNAVSISHGLEPTQSFLAYEATFREAMKKPFRCEHQPIYNLGNGTMSAVELFTRGPTKDLADPEALFKSARENDMLAVIDMHCLKSAVTYAAKLPPGIQVVHVNLFPSTLSEIPVEQILALTRELRRSRRLCLELSLKHMTVNPSQLAPQIQALKQAGILIALDDLGFGASALEAVALFEPNCVKIDNSLVRGIAKDARKAKMVSNILRMTAAVESITIAKGIESAEDLKEIRSLGLPLGQGWLWKTTPTMATRGSTPSHWANVRSQPA
ncbi:MAG: diguanylate cyclase [Cyanobacteria bacterium]|nr:diguanylate cyclase [Cyanobacteriota bacterium]